jgi:hypothetical protein
MVSGVIECSHVTIHYNEVYVLDNRTLVMELNFHFTEAI